MILIVILIITICPMAAISKISSKRPIRGVYTSDINSYQLLVPHKINVEGDIQSFYLPHFFKHDFQSRRRKRDCSHPDMVSYSLHFNGKDHQLLLWPNHGFVAPQTVAEFHYPGSEMTVQARKLRLINPALCHYTGTIRGADGSKAALSLCDGLAGYIKTKDGTFFIEPVENFGPNEMGHHLHVIYDHPKSLSSTPTKGNPERPQREATNCGTSNWRSGWEKAFQQYFSTLQHNEMPEHNVAQRKSHESVHRYLEVLVVADKMFLDFHKDKDYENYILTVMNMVSDFYHDGSTGNLLDVTVVRIIYLDREVSTLDLSISPDGSSTLQSFCKWQHEINPKDVEHPQHHDIAVLITRHDICSESDGEKNCGLLGLAYMASACVPSDACAINEDKGLILGIVVAHEIGHIMGCEHDIEEKSGCPAMADEKFYHVMSPYVSLATSVWSSCSRTFMTELLENNLGECLNDEPPESAYKFDEMTPGSVYDADYQCSLLFPNSTHCETDPEEFCEKLFCRVNPTKCLSNGEPPAEGTKCGANKWCMRQKCVNLGERPAGIDGGWAEWGDYGTCSRSCGGGIKLSERSCTNPTPRNGGRYCLGEAKRFKICNIKPCPEDSISFRAIQCSEYDKIPHSGRFHKWKPYYPTDKNGDSSCILYCINEEHTYSKLSPRAKDGTPCKSGTFDLCVSGQCRRVGCDFVLGSTAIDDKCGICKGDNSGCKRTAGAFTKGGKGYTKVITLPKGARNIVIRESQPSDNTIAIASASGHFYLNGNNQEEIDGEKHLGKDIALYEHPELNQEEVFIAGPLRQPLNFYVVFYEPRNVGFNYEYYVRDKNYKPTRKVVEDEKGKGKSCYHWEFVEWSKCNRRCDGGEEKSEPACVSNNGDGAVSERFCSPDSKPEAKTKVCNRQSCKVRWHTGEWGLCTGCEHQPGFQVRQVWCAREAPRWEETDVITNDVECVTTDGPKPNIKQLCVSPCPPSCPRSSRSSPKACPGKLDKHFFKEFYREIDMMMALAPEAIFGMHGGWDNGNLKIARNSMEGGLIRDGKLNKYSLDLPQGDPRKLFLDSLKSELISSLKTAPTDCSKGQCGEKCGEKCVNLDTHLPNKFSKYLNLPRVEEVARDRPLGIFIIDKPHDRGAVHEEDDVPNLQRLYRDSSVTKPCHSIATDKVDKNHLKILEAPYIPPNAQNLSDEAFEKLGDRLSGSMDAKHGRVLKGDAAICALKGTNKSPEITEQPPPPEENATERDSPDY